MRSGERVVFQDRRVRVRAPSPRPRPSPSATPSPSHRLLLLGLELLLVLVFFLPEPALLLLVSSEVNAAATTIRSHFKRTMDNTNLVSSVVELYYGHERGGDESES